MLMLVTCPSDILQHHNCAYPIALTRHDNTMSHVLWGSLLMFMLAQCMRLFTKGFMSQAVRNRLCRTLLMSAACMWAAVTLEVLLTHVTKSGSKVLHCRGGLEGRLLGLTLQAEHPQLETQCSALLQKQEEQRLELAALDNHLLQSLATSKVYVHTLCGRHGACSTREYS